METQQACFSRQRRVDHSVRLHPGLLHLCSDLIRAWRLPTANKPAPVRNTCSRRILRCVLTTCSFVASSCRERSTSICYLRLSSPLRTQLALVFQIQRHSRSDEKSFQRGGSTPSSATFMNFRIPRVPLITAFHSRSTGG